MTFAPELHFGIGLICIALAVMIALAFYPNDHRIMRGIVIVFLGYAVAFELWTVALILIVPPIFSAVMFCLRRWPR